MSNRGYGDAVAHSLGLERPPTLVTHSLRSAQIGMSRFSIGEEQLGMSPKIPAEDTFILAIYLNEVPHHELWKRGRPYIRQGYAPNSMRLVNLAEEFSALIASQANRAKAIMAGIGGRDVGLTEVARECGLSRGYFTKAFKARTGLTPHQWRQRYRIDRAKTLLLETKFDVAEIALECGFADQSHLTRVFARMVGDSPASWRRRRRN
jgi:AraC-like DNA-binding protein